MQNNQERILEILKKAAESETRSNNPLTISEAEHQAAMLRFLAEFREKRTGIIMPAIEAIASTVTEHGHGIAIIDDVLDEETPRIEVRMTPKQWGDRKPSKLCISADPLSQTVQFWSNQFTSPRYPIERITAQLVEHHLLNYIEKVFEHLYDK